MRPYQKVAPHFKTYAYPSFHQKPSIFQLSRPNSYCLASQRWIYLAFLPPFLKGKFFEGVVLAYKRGTDRNTKTTTTTTTNTKTIKHRLFLGFSSIKSKSLIRQGVQVLFYISFSQIFFNKRRIAFRAFLLVKA